MQLPHQHPTLFSYPKYISACACILLSACSGSGGDSGTAQVGSINLDSSASAMIIDASSYQDYAYLNLESGEMLELSEAQATASDAWHIAFRRASVKLNGGTSGPGNVSGALTAAQEDFYDAQGEPDSNVFLNATPDQEAEHLAPELDISSLDFISDDYSAAIQGSGNMTGTDIDMGWYRYNFATHQTSLNNENWWLLRSNLGTSYARFRATALAYDPLTGLDVTFDFDVQANGTDQFATTASFNAHVDAAGGQDCFDFDTNSAVSCDHPAWDIKLEIDGRNWHLWSNGGVSGSGSGGAFGPFTSTEASAYTAGHISPEGIDISAHYSSDASVGIFHENSWYAYNLQGNHKLWPNYRTFAIDTDSSDPAAAKFLLQIVNYYSDTGISGHPNIRFIEITSN